MYSRFPRHIISLGRFLAVFALLVFVVVEEGYGQRVYADAQQSRPRQSLFVTLSEVRDQDNPVDNNYDNYSTLYLNVGALGLISTHQNLQFINRPNPTSSTPVIIKFGTTNSLLTVADQFTVQRTYGGREELVNPSYSGSQLLNLLNLLGGNQNGHAIIPPNGLPFDGVRVEINTALLSLISEAYYYYAFYITPPQVTHNEIALCEGEAGAIEIQNHYIENGTPYTYRLYDNEIDGSEVALVDSITTALMAIPSNLPAGTYWLEAREDDLYPSARTQVVVTRSPVPHRPQLSITSTTN